MLDYSLSELGRIVITPGADAALKGVGGEPSLFIWRHRAGDWGELEEDETALNKHSVLHGGRVLSSYDLVSGDRLWVITEADRRVTTMMLVEEY